MAEFSDITDTASRPRRTFRLAVIVGAAVFIAFLIWLVFRDNSSGRSLRYALSFEGYRPARGVATIDLEQRSICVFAPDLDWAKAGHIHLDPIGPSPDPVVVTIFEPPTELARTNCTKALDSVQLEEIVDNVDRYYIEYHKDDAGKFSAWSAFVPEDD